MILAETEFFALKKGERKQFKALFQFKTAKEISDSIMQMKMKNDDYVMKILENEELKLELVKTFKKAEETEKELWGKMTQ